MKCLISGIPNDFLMLDSSLVSGQLIGLNIKFIIKVIIGREIYQGTKKGKTKTAIKLNRIIAV